MASPPPDRHGTCGEPGKQSQFIFDSLGNLLRKALVSVSRKSSAAIAPRKYVTINEAAEYLSVHPNSIRNWIESGKLTGYRLPSTGPRGAVLWRLDLNELDEIISATATR